MKLGLAFALLLFFTFPAPAAWVILRNDTTATIIVQDLRFVGGRVLPGKPIKLLPGETFREFHAAAAGKSIQVLDANTRRVLTKENLTVGNRDVQASIRRVNGQVRIIQTPDAPGK